MSDDEFDDDQFYLQFPLWFVVAETATAIDRANGRRLLATNDPGAFCGAAMAGNRCVAAFSDEDLAVRHSRLHPGTVPVALSDQRDVIKLLQRFGSLLAFNSVVLDVKGDQSLSNLRIPIPKFIGFLRKPLKPPTD